MRIVLGTGTLQVGGAEMQMVRLADEFVRRGHSVHVIALVSGGPLSAELDRVGATWEVGTWTAGSKRLLPAGFDSYPAWVRRIVALPGAPVRQVAKLRSFTTLWRHLADLEPDVCHAFLPGAFHTLLPGAWIHRVPARVSGRMSLTSRVDVRPALRALTALSTLCGNAVVANSAEVADDSLRSEWLRPTRLEVIGNGVDIPDMPADVGRDNPQGAMVGNLREVKRHLDVVAALQRLDRPPLIRCFGEGPTRPAIEAAVSAAGLSDRFVLEGSVPAAGKQFLDAQFGVHASSWEGLPNAVLEAMAAGVPMIATRVGGVPELIEHEVTGLLVEPRDPEGLAAAIERLVGDPELRMRLGAAARERARDYSWDRCADRHLALYEQLLGPGASRRSLGGRLIPSSGSSATVE